MAIEIVEKYVNELIDRSTLEEPVWNIEKIRAGKKASWDYIDGCMIMSLLELYKVGRNEKYFKFAEEYISYRVQEDGTINGYHKEELNLDNINEGKNLFTLYDLTGKEKYAKAASRIYQQILEMPRTKEGNFWHKMIYPNQVWLDGLYMAQPFYIEYENRFNDKKNYEDIFHQFFEVENNMTMPMIPRGRCSGLIKRQDFPETSGFVLLAGSPWHFWILWCLQIRIILIMTIYSRCIVI